MSWETKRLEEVCNFVRGLTYSKKDEVQESGNAVLRATNIDLKSNSLNLEDIRYISDSVKIKEEKKVRKNDILICTASGSKSHLGKVALIKEELDFSYGGFMAVLRCENAIYPPYLFKILISENFKNHLSKLSDGANINNLKFDLIKDFPVTLPPLSLQKQIVEKLDTAFTDIDKAISATEKNIENVEALFQSYLNQIFETKGEGWESSTIEEAFLIKPPKSELKEIPLNSKVSFMGMDKLGINQKYSIPEEARDLEKVFKNYTYFSENDVLLAKITPCFENGKLGIAKELKNGIGFGSSEFVVLRTKSSISNEWLYYFLLRDEFRESGKEVMTGAVGHKRVPKEFIEKSVITFPKLKSQEYIITNFEYLQEKTSKLKELSKDKINNLIALKSSLLSQAFSGEFTKDVA